MNTDWKDPNKIQIMKQGKSYPLKHLNQVVLFVQTGNSIRLGNF
jgi:hypothetical protein